jgi:hypothetical protein
VVLVDRQSLEDLVVEQSSGGGHGAKLP